MKVFIGADHGGYGVKEKLKGFLKNKRVDFVDLGTYNSDPMDYPDVASKVAKQVAKSKGSRGILVCGSGTGMVIAANKVKGIRAAVAYDPYSAKMSRVDNDSNILGLRARFFPYEKTKKIVSTWLSTKFSNKKRHKDRIRKIARLEK